MEIRKSSEDYLEAILILKNKLDNVRNVDISESMNYSKASITHAVKVLRKGGYVRTDEDKNIFLTPLGQETAEKIYENTNFSENI